MISSTAEYDVVIMGGAFSGAAAGMMLKREHPDMRILIVERTVQFDRKVGESTSEVAGCFLTRVLHQGAHLCAHHYQKHGLRLWFCKTPQDSVDDLTEIGPRYQSRLPTFQLDRALLDEHLLKEACDFGCELMRPATVKTIALSEDAAPHTLEITPKEGPMRTVTARWLIDASGKAAVLAKKLGLQSTIDDEHPTSSIWCRFRNVNGLDSFKSRSMHPKLMENVRGLRTSSTNHLMGRGWWCWIIPLSDGSYSVGVTWDRRFFSLPEGPSLLARLQAHLMTHPVGRLMFENAVPVENDTFYYKNLAYRAERVAGNRWIIVGDAAGFMDPMYSHGLDFCGHTVYAACELVKKNLAGEDTQAITDYLNMAYPRSWRIWFEALYKDKYAYMGDAELMNAAFLLDLATYFIGPVRLVYAHPDYEWTRMPYDGPAGTLFGNFMAFYNRRLASLAQERMRKGIYGRCNNGHVWLPRQSFSPDTSAVRLLWDGLKVWLKAEITTWLAPTPATSPAMMVEKPAEA
ncbi:tryptophan 7-halogenase [Prosthecobacter sp.]|uniref:NAD(P)/FAD-dependent oxidoreductase n=1 Tax=Prosthecobacter sp. TaxID=1965333 RepID=UPI001DE88A72|nr:tryptophan 7-halogenase [Prosthecobacter sp.]MCB1277474.1 tryptophan 7-halogenase [Prosthecobacter sp.]